MKLAGIALEQVIIMLIIIVLGFVLTKLKVISVDSKKSLSNILVYLVVPFIEYSNVLEPSIFSF